MLVDVDAEPNMAARLMRSTSIPQLVLFTPAASGWYRIDLQGEQPPARVAPGLYGFQVTAPEGSGGEELDLQLSFDGNVLARRRVPIGVDRWVAEGEPIAQGGCTLNGPASSAGSLVGAALLLLALIGARRRT